MLEVYALHTLPEEEFQAFAPAFMALLPPDSAAGVMRFRHEADRQRSLLGEAMTRLRLASLTGNAPKELPIRRLEKGKPILEHDPPLHFNISHSGGWVVTAISDQEVGIDVERLRDPQYRIAERFFSEEELYLLNQLDGVDKRNYFFDLWTLKESYLKLLGKGLTQSLGSFTLRKTKDGFLLVLDETPDHSVTFIQYPLGTGYKLSLCSRGAGDGALFEQLTVPELSKRIAQW